MLLGLGYVLFFVLGRVKSTAAIIKDAWPILIAETVIVSTVVIAFFLGGWILKFAVLALAARVAFEAANVAAQRAYTLPPIQWAMIVTIAAFISLFLPFLLIGIAGIIAIVASTIISSRPGTAPKTAVIFDLLKFPFAPVVIFAGASAQPGLGALLLIAFILVETFDSYALLGGKLMGRRKAFPTLSPNKTIEGLLIGALMLIATAVIAGALMAATPVWIAALVALASGVLTVTGDLTASLLKRKSGVKDYPVIMAHQGGLLDITDAWIATGAGLAVVFQIAQLN